MDQGPTQDKFEQLKSKLKETWSRLSNDDIALANGKKDQFFAKLKEVYGLSLEDAQKRFDELEKACGCMPEKAV